MAQKNMDEERIIDRERYIIVFTSMLLIPNSHLDKDAKTRIRRAFRTGVGIPDAELDNIESMVHNELDKFQEFLDTTYGRRN